MYRHSISILLIALGLFLCIRCSNPAPVNISLHINHVVQDKKLIIENKMYPTEVGHDYEVHRLKYYLSKFVLKTIEGKSVLNDTIYLCDILNPTSLNMDIGLFPCGQYSSLSFILGLDESRNFEGGLTNTMRNNSMEWPVLGEKGYHYMKFEGKYDSMGSGKMKNFNLHTGPTKNNSNFVEIELDFPQLLKISSNMDIILNMNLNEIFHNPINYNFNDFDQGIMPNQSAQLILKQNMSNVFSIDTVILKEDL